MKKLLILLSILLLTSCMKDDMFIGPEEPIRQMIFEVSESSVKDGQEISFEILVEERYWLVITDEETKSVVAKESFLPLSGLNTRKIYTNSLPKKKLKLTLENKTDILNTTFINVE